MFEAKEKSSEKSIEISVNLVPVLKRKALRSKIGVTYARINIFGLLISLGIGSVAIFNYIINFDKENYLVSLLRGFLGIPDLYDLPQTDEAQVIILSALACFMMGTFMQLSVHWRAYFIPRYIAKNPPLSNFWPMAASLILRITSEVLYHWVKTSRHILMSFFWITASLAYSIVVVDIYWYDDDDPPMRTQGENGIILKPWYVEPLNLPK